MEHRGIHYYLWESLASGLCTRSLPFREMPSRISHEINDCSLECTNIIYNIIYKIYETKIQERREKGSSRTCACFFFCFTAADVIVLFYALLHHARRENCEKDSRNIQVDLFTPCDSIGIKDQTYLNTQV